LLGDELRIVARVAIRATCDALMTFSLSRNLGMNRPVSRSAMRMHAVDGEGVAPKSVISVLALPTIDSHQA